MEQLKKLLLSLTAMQRVTILFCALGMAAGVVWFSRWQQDAGLRPLYTSLAPEDANAMIQKLRESGVLYKVSENGTSLMVPEARVAELRLEMAGLGLPKTGRIGFEIFDKTNFGITDFAEHVNYRRAVEGELERSVMALAAVQQARVHVSLPKESVFTDSRESAKASVLVGLRPGARLSAQNVVAITNLVSSAVEGLAPESVSVVDMSGNLLSRPRRDGLPDGAQISEAALEYRQAIEHDLAVKINNTLDPLLGAEKFRTGVSAEVDMTSGEQSEETFDPTKSVMVTSQKTEDSSGTTRAGAAATPTPPGTAANLPQAAAPHPTNGSTSTKRSESIAYQSSRVTKHVKLPQGAIKRLSIAVLLDQGAKWEGQGKQMHRVVTPPDTEKIKAIQTLVSTLVGLNPERGDQLTVEALPFDSTLNMELPAAQTSEPGKRDNLTGIEALKQKPMILWGSAGGAVVVIALVVFALTRGKRREGVRDMPEVLPPASTMASLAAAPGSQSLGQTSAIAANEGSRLPALMPSRTEVLLNQLQESGRNNPEAWAGVLRGWLSEEEAH
ncbi:MAG TPA: flagellar basal-body MS-ring/collar protein FliF [Bryobacteraceae bacterium]|jgi:flagellar M-ring protein FliF|nr:flagellar basal-body MS-ring/collar protein FliF [Bryobacteraceae bacterium]